MKRFIFDSILDEENICNLEKEKHKIMKGVDKGLKLLVYGKRNMGKTSLVKNVIAKSWLRRQPSGFFMYVDLMGVKQLSQISERMTIAFSEAYNDCFKMKSVFNNMLKIITGIKPSIELDEKGYPKLSFGIMGGEKIRPFTGILKQLDLIYASNIPIFLVLDEFQDIALIDEAEALFRNGLEHIDSRIPVVILGSKQHLLNRIFARPKAPFFNWGTHVYFEAINYHEYWQYMDERFKQEGFRISFENAVYLQDKMSRMPEAINRLCFALLFHDIPKGEITKEDINSGLSKVVSDRRNEPEIYLSSFTAAEQKVIVNLAKMEPVLHPQGKDFIKSINLTAPGVRKIMMKLEDKTVVYKEEAGYILADPLLKQHILRFRL
jgi:Cdc6-like AAA superfamily ATPase